MAPRCPICGCGLGTFSGESKVSTAQKIRAEKLGLTLNDDICESCADSQILDRQKKIDEEKKLKLKKLELNH